MMRIALIPPAFTPYQDDSHFSTLFLCQQIGEYFKWSGIDVTILGLMGSGSSLFDVESFDGQAQPSILVLGEYVTGDGLSGIVDAAISGLLSGKYAGVINFGHDALPYSVDHPAFLNVVTFSKGMSCAVDASIVGNLDRFGFLSKAQAASYGVYINEPLLCPVQTSTQSASIGCERLMYAGRVCKSKGILNAVKVMKRTGLPLVVAGHNEETSDLHTAISSGATYLGCLERGKLHQKMRTSTALLQLQACDVQEAFGMVTAEALCAGLPVITWNCGANTELVDESNGVVVQPGDLDAAASSIQIVSSWSFPKREGIRRAAISKYSLPNVGERYLKWFTTHTK